MAKGAFTIKKLESLKPKKSPWRFYDSMGPTGLNIQVSPKGRKIFNVSYRDPETGSQHFVKIGTYPATTITTARERALEIWAKIEDGQNPKVIPKGPDRFSTVGDLFAAYIEDAVNRGVRSTDNFETVYKSNIREYIGDMAAKDVTPSDIHDLLTVIYERGAMTVLKHTRQLLSAVFNYGMRAEYQVGRTGHKFGLTMNPVLAVPVPNNGAGTRDLFPSTEEIAEIWIRVYEFSSVIAGAALKWHLAACGQRLQETVGVMKDQLVDVNGVSCVYMERTKAGNPHIIPIGRHMAQVLKEIEPFNRHSKAVFPMRASDTQPIRWRSMSQIIRKTRPVLEHTAWRPNDLRRAAKTYLGEVGVSMEHRNIMQNHGQTGVASRHYDRAKYLDIKLEVMAKWDRLLDEAIADIKRKNLRAVA